MLNPGAQLKNHNSLESKKQLVQISTPHVSRENAWIWSIICTYTQREVKADRITVFKLDPDGSFLYNTSVLVIYSVWLRFLAKISSYFHTAI